MPPRRSHPRREIKTECPIFIRQMQRADERALMALVYDRILVRQCYDVLLANLQKFSFHFTIGLVSFTSYSLHHSIVYALLTGVVLYPLLLFVLARFILVPIDANFGEDSEDLIQGMYNYWSKEAKGRSLLVGEMNERVLAMVAVQQVSADVAEIQRLATAAEYERKGIGTTLMKNIINLCRDSEYKELTMEINEVSLPARVLCKQLGFSEVQRKTGSFAFSNTVQYHMLLDKERRKRVRRGSKKQNTS